MKKLSIILFLSMLFGMMNPIHSKAQDNKQAQIVTDSLYVYGVCNMCKSRIENAALIKGVKKVSWNKTTQYLTVIYKPAKVSLSQIEDEIVQAGHDTKNKTADDKSYQKLPGCCAYRSDDIEIH